MATGTEYSRVRIACAVRTIPTTHIPDSTIASRRGPGATLADRARHATKTTAATAAISKTIHTGL